MKLVKKCVKNKLKKSYKNQFERFRRTKNDSEVSNETLQLMDRLGLTRDMSQQEAEQKINGFVDFNYVAKANEEYDLAEQKKEDAKQKQVANILTKTKNAKNIDQGIEKLNEIRQRELEQTLTEAGYTPKDSNKIIQSVLAREQDSVYANIVGSRYGKYSYNYAMANAEMRADEQRDSLKNAYAYYEQHKKNKNKTKEEKEAEERIENTFKDLGINLVDNRGRLRSSNVA